MSLYLDTSLVVALLTAEASTDAVQIWLDQQHVEDLAISDWVITEFSSALSIKMRTGQLTASHRAAALSEFAKLVAQAFTVLPLSADEFRTAARFGDQHKLGLRAGDSLHLAVCATHGATLYTLDRDLCKAGPAVGVKTVLLR